MQINNLLNCCKPRHFGNSATESCPEGKRLRYKHYEEMDNDTLSKLCLKKAYDTAQNSKKMRIRNLIPALAVGAIGTSVAITQPGKLANKLAYGLGFLAITGGVGALSKKVTSLADEIGSVKKGNGKDDSANKKAARFGFTAGFLAMGTALLALCSAPKLMASMATKHPQNKLIRFIASEKDKLAAEINDSKLGKFVENKLNPFLKKNPKTEKALDIFAPIAAVLGFVPIYSKLTKSISDDIRKNATDNFFKAKLIQKKAKEHFDKIEAQEV